MKVYRNPLLNMKSSWWSVLLGRGNNPMYISSFRSSLAILGEFGSPLRFHLARLVEENKPPWRWKKSGWGVLGKAPPKKNIKNNGYLLVVVEQTLFIFTPPYLGKWSNLTFAYVSNGLVNQPPTSYSKMTQVRYHWFNHYWAVTIGQFFCKKKPDLNLLNFGVIWPSLHLRGVQPYLLDMAPSQ